MSELTAEQEQAIVAFNHAAEELRFFKSQQWNVANYALVAQAVLVAAPALFPDDRAARFAHILGVAVSFSVVIAAVTLIRALDNAIRKERTRMSAAHKLLPALWQIHKPAHETARADVTGTLMLAVVIGAVVAIAIDFANAQ
jgi:hypothetical protein